MSLPLYLQFGASPTAAHLLPPSLPPSVIEVVLPPVSPLLFSPHRHRCAGPHLRAGRTKRERIAWSRPHATRCSEGFHFERRFRAMEAQLHGPKWNEFIGLSLLMPRNISTTLIQMLRNRYKAMSYAHQEKHDMVGNLGQAHLRIAVSRSAIDILSLPVASAAAVMCPKGRSETVTA
jgi:hypothetical protein